MRFYPRLTPWTRAIKQLMGTDWFLYRDLPAELQDRANLLRAHDKGLLDRSKGYIGHGNTRRLWRVR